jgi:hypothetical protein
MNGSLWMGWRRDLIVGGLASLLTSLVLVPVAWSSERRGQELAEAAHREAQAATLRAEQMAAEAEQQRALAQRNLVEQAADFAGFGDHPEAEAMRVTTDAVSPEVPKDGWLLIDKKAASWAPGDIVVFRQEGRNYLGRVVAFDRGKGSVTVARNGEKSREVPVADLLGRGVLNTR